jgi:hypothetical protein
VPHPADAHEIFLCAHGQVGRGEHGVWLSVWVDDVDAVHTAWARGPRAQKENLASSDPAEVSKAPERARITYVDM